MAIGTPVSIGYEQNKTAESSSDISLSAAVEAGSLIVVGIAFDGNGTFSSITDTAGNTYSQGESELSGTGATDLKILVYYAENALALSVGNLIRVTWGTQPAAKILQAVKVSGIKTVSPLHRFSSGTGTGTAPESGAVSQATIPKTLAIGFVAHKSSSSNTFTQDSSPAFAQPPITKGTAGGPTNTNVTLCGGYYVIPSAAASPIEYTPTLEDSVAWCCTLTTFIGADQPLVGSSTVTITPSAPMGATAPIAGSGSITISPSAIMKGDVNIAGSAALSFAPVGLIGILTQIAGSSTLTFAPAAALSLLAFISGSSTLSFGGSGFLDFLRVVVDRIVAEIEAAIDAAGTVSTFYLSTDRFVTTPTDTPAHIAFDPRIIDPGTIGLNAFSDGRTGGGSKLETGEIVLVNVDGGLDGWNEYSFDGRAIRILGGSVGVYPDDYTTLFVGTVESVEMSTEKAVLRLRDKQWRLTAPALSTRYAGTNSLPNGVEGTPDDIAGQVKPRAYGKVFNVGPQMVNTSKLTYEVGVCNSIDAVYDQGLALTAGTTHGSLAALQAATVAAGTFDRCPSAGYFRIGSNPAGAITADVTQGATAASRTAAQILKTLALAAGFVSGDIADDDVTALDAVAPQVLGLWLADESSFQSAMDQVANSVGAWYGFDASGKLRMGRISEPTTPSLVIRDFDMLDGFERRPPKDNGIPVWSVVIHHTKFWTVQPNDLAGAVPNPRRAMLAHEYRRTVAEDATVKTQWLLAGTMEVDTLFSTPADAATEAARRLALYKVRRDLYDVPITLNALATYSLKIGSVITLQYPRFGLDAGHDFLVVGVRLELSTNRAILTLWG